MNSNLELSATAGPVRYDEYDGAAWLTLDTPENRNAISARLLAALTAGIRRAAESDAVRTIVITHTGNTFCAGADLSEAGEGSAYAQAEHRTATFLEFLSALVGVPKPSIALVNGHTRAGGMGLVAACDMAFAGPRSSFALTEVKLGLAAAMVSVPIRARVNERAAARYLLTGEKFDSATAADMGLVTAATDAPHAAVAQVLGELRLAAPQSLAVTKELLNRGMLDALAEQGAHLAELSAKLFVSEQAQEGLSAFLDKRPPQWTIETKPR